MPIRFYPKIIRVNCSKKVLCHAQRIRLNIFLYSSIFRDHPAVNLKKTLDAKNFLERITASIKNIIFSTFPGTTAQEREDIDQEVKLKIWRKAASGKKIDNLRSYLWKVVYTTTLDILDERMPTISSEEIAERADSVLISRVREASPEFPLEKKEMTEIIRSTVASLPPRRRTVVQLWLSNMTLEEIADFLGWNGNQVRHLLYRGIQDIKDKAREYLGRREFSPKDRGNSEEEGKHEFE